MIDPKMEMLSTVVVTAVVRLGEDSSDASQWAAIESARAVTADEDPKLAAAIESRDLDALRAIAEGWGNGKGLLPESDRAVLKRAMKAFRKSLKVTVLNHESTLGGGPLSAGGRSTTIVGIQPPQRYPAPVWRELTRQGRLVANHGGTYELPPGG
jgi:hypothetical protein